MRLTRISVLLATTGLAVVGVGTATAATAAPAICATAGYVCSTVPVPLDHSGVTPGTINLSVARKPLGAAPTATAVVALAGGPGQAALPFTADFAKDLAPALATRDLVVFDQRGIGASSPLSCPSLSSLHTSILDAAKGCSDKLAANRGFYKTADSVADIEAIRVAGGYQKLVLYGVSYGTKLALAYAAAYPQNVESLVLDSVVTPDGPDPFSRSSFAALPRVLSDLCALGCQSFTKNASKELATLAKQLRAHVLRGSFYDGHGKRIDASMNEGDLLDSVDAGDLNPALREELPAAVHAALSHDPTPLLRLAATAEGVSGADQAVDSDGVSEPAYLATVCEEGPLPWPRSATTATSRVASLEQAVKSTPTSATAPFSRTSALSTGATLPCVGWTPSTPTPLPAPGPLPAVPTLMIEGGGDVRTPVENAQAVAAQIPGAQILVVPRTGHSVVSSDLSTCSHDGLVAFFAGTPVAPCAADAAGLKPTPLPPKTFAATHPAAGVSGKAGRTLAAVQLTVRDALLQLTGVGAQQSSLPNAVGGLRGGSVLYSSKSGVRLRDAVYVPGVTVNGTVPRGKAAARFTITGASAAHGTLAIAASGAVTGHLGGHKIVASLAASLQSTRDVPRLR